MDRTIFLEYVSDQKLVDHKLWSLILQSCMRFSECFFCVSEFRSYLGHNQVRSTKVIKMHVIVTGHLLPSVFDGDKNVTL